MGRGQYWLKIGVAAMYLKALQLRHFRNYREQVITFTAPKTIVLGDNAQGKSNLLESIELLATLRSHRCHRDRDLIQTGQAAGRIAATVQREVGLSELALMLRAGGRRTAIRNGEKLRRQGDFLGALNAVQFSSLDLELVRGGPGERRTWLDTLLMQLEPVYINILGQYAQALKQRNALLRQAKGHPDPTQLALWAAQLAALGTRLMRRRSRGLSRLVPIAQQWHQAISGQTEVLTLQYRPNVAIVSDDPTEIQGAFLEKIQQRAIAEQQQHTSLVGPHRDDIEFTINDTPARQYASQGQQRTLVLALKLAELKLIESVVGEPPLLLLDDVLAELDLNRQNQLLEAIQDRFQTVITTTHLGSFEAQWLKASQVLTVKAGKLAAS
ncbi:MAG: DNA replication/repair protein RecF [Leptolyngbyaceae cyanobacterium]